MVKRLVSALVMIPPVLGAIFYGYPAFDLLVVFGFAVLAYEWIGLCGVAPYRWPAIVFYVFGIAALLLVSLFDVQWGLAAVLGGGGVLVIVHVLSGEGPHPSSSAPAQTLPHLPWLALGFVYIGFAMTMMVALRHDDTAGRHLVLLLFLIAWATDTGAYVFGRLIGGRKLAPRLSPNKTWAGFFGGMACAAAVGAGFALYFGNSRHFGWAAAAAVMGIISQCGDLLESRIKRLFQVKDTSTLIPGHGGFLDRLDSLLAMSWAAGLFYWLAREEVLRWM